ncbi:hypothetical protein HMN09_00706600 [Mycena chlorophos]|uniref:Carbohydrate-binding module family 19 domain-containing protein n=1 Tax=Mycena chlorophos TaxID=658473 RepID=A0A8H6WDM6_MYCCL|nr:hypothetical protein HMN09_00706600 [Mycena chlorophos]
MFTLLVLFSSALMAHSAPVRSARDSGSFQLQNGLDAQKLNAQFKSLTASSNCTDGEQACVSSSFAQCVGGAFQLSPCSSGTICAALPLVNSAGTSITCDTAADAAARIAATGATGGLDGSSSGSNSTSPETSSTTVAATTTTKSHQHTGLTSVTSPATTTTSSNFQLRENALAAQKLNAHFATLAISSPCTDGETACIGSFSGTCKNGTFELKACQTGDLCAAFPLTSGNGTQLQCDSQQDAEARFAAAGVTGGITGFLSSPSPESGSSAVSSSMKTKTKGQSTSTKTPNPAVTSGAGSSSSANSSDFHLQNGLDAQKLNAQFPGLTTTSFCIDGQQACVGNSFAQCVSGKYELTPCSGGLICAALPLVNKVGVSVTCDSQSDAEARITATGATGGLTGAST